MLPPQVVGGPLVNTALSLINLAYMFADEANTDQMDDNDQQVLAGLVAMTANEVAVMIGRGRGGLI